MRAAIFGAGNIGRGLLGEVFADSGYQLTFIDADAGIVDMLRSDPTYSVRSADRERTFEIESVVDAADEESVHAAVAAAEVVATAVGPAVLKIVAPAIGRGLGASGKSNVNVLACENLHPNSTALRNHIIEACGEGVVEGVGFPNVVVDRIAPGSPGSRIVDVEPVFEFVVDQDSWLGAQPDGPITFTSNLDAYKLRKLWLVNGLHAATAWLGLAKGYEHIHEAMADSGVRETVTGIGATMASILAASVDEFDDAALSEYLERSLARFSDASLPDEARRVARNPLDKLAAGERILAAANRADTEGFETAPFAEAIVAALNVSADDVAGAGALREALEVGGWEGVVVDHSGVRSGGVLYNQIESRMKPEEKEKGIAMITEEIVITNPAGLHARPAAEIVEAAKATDADIRIHKGDKAANAKSIMSVLALGANTGDTVQLTVEGEGADAVVEALRRIMQSEEH